MRFNLLLLSLSASALVTASVTPSPSSSSLSTPEDNDLSKMNQTTSEESAEWKMTLGERSHERKTSHKKKHKAHQQSAKQASSKKSGSRITYYAGNQLANPACGGKTPTDDDMVGAVVKDGGYGSCGDRITLQSGDKQVTITIVDYCAGCPSPGGFDLTKGAFKQLDPLSKGVIEDFKYWKS